MQQTPDLSSFGACKTCINKEQVMKQKIQQYTWFSIFGLKLFKNLLILLDPVIEGNSAKTYLEIAKIGKFKWNQACLQLYSPIPPSPSLLLPSQSLIKFLKHSTKQSNFTKWLCGLKLPICIIHAPHSVKIISYETSTVKDKINKCLILTIVVWWQNCNALSRLGKKKTKEIKLE